MELISFNTDGKRYRNVIVILSQTSNTLVEALCCYSTGEISHCELVESIIMQKAAEKDIWFKLVDKRKS